MICVFPDLNLELLQLVSSHTGLLWVMHELEFKCGSDQVIHLPHLLDVLGQEIRAALDYSNFLQLLNGGGGSP